MVRIYCVEIDRIFASFSSSAHLNTHVMKAHSFIAHVSFNYLCLEIKNSTLHHKLWKLNLHDHLLMVSTAPVRRMSLLTATSARYESGSYGRLLSSD